MGGEREKMRFPGTATQEIRRTTAELARARTCQQETQLPSFDKPVDLIQQCRDFLDLADDHPFHAGRKQFR